MSGIIDRIKAFFSAAAKERGGGMIENVKALRETTGLGLAECR